MFREWIEKVYRTWIFKPVAGGNGVIQMNELAKFVLLVSFVSMLCTWPKYHWPNEIFYGVLAAVAAMAGLSPTKRKSDYEN